MCSYHLACSHILNVIIAVSLVQVYVIRTLKSINLVDTLPQSGARKNFEQCAVNTCVMAEHPFRLDLGMDSVYNN